MAKGIGAYTGCRAVIVGGMGKPREKDSPHLGYTIAHEPCADGEVHGPDHRPAAREFAAIKRVERGRLGEHRRARLPRGLELILN